MRMKKILHLFLAWIGIVMTGGVQAQAVFDNGEMFSHPEEMKIRYELVRLLRHTSIPVVVHTERSLGGVTVEGKAAQLFDSYRIGEKWANNGILVLIALDDQQFRIEVGYGMEWVLPDEKASNLSDVMVPYFARKDFYGGVHALLQGMQESIPQLDWSLTPLSLSGITAGHEGKIIAFIYRGGNKLKSYSACDPQGPQFSGTYTLSLAEGSARYTLQYTSHMEALLSMITSREDAMIYARVQSYKQRQLQLVGVD